MRIKKFFIPLLLTFCFYNFCYSEYTYKASKISIILNESDIIFVGKVSKVEGTISKYTSYIEIAERTGE